MSSMCIKYQALEVESSYQFSQSTIYNKPAPRPIRGKTLFDLQARRRQNQHFSVTVISCQRLLIMSVIVSNIEPPTVPIHDCLWDLPGQQYEQMVIRHYRERPDQSL